MKPELNDMEYPFTVRPLSMDEGGGYLVEFPDLPGCISDGDSVAEAIHNAQDALAEVLAAMKKHGDLIPPPGTKWTSAANASGQWRQRIPRSLHSALTRAADLESVSLNMLVTQFISEGLAKREVRAQLDAVLATDEPSRGSLSTLIGLGVTGGIGLADAASRGSGRQTATKAKSRNESGSGQPSRGRVAAGTRTRK